MKDKLLVYGANGYTGKLLAKHLIGQGVTPILAGRSRAVEKLGDEIGCTSKIFTLEQAASNLEDVAVLINLAGPFALTQRPLIEACLATKTNYVDIAGEVNGVKSAWDYETQSKEANVTIVPAAGFGVVPTDWALKKASESLDQVDRLILAYATEGAASRGTLKTVLKDINTPGVKMVDGELKRALPTESTLEFSVGDKNFTAVYNPWRADIFTAQKSTGVGNIDSYTTFPGPVVKMMKGKWLWLRDLLLNRLLKFLPEGPTEKQLRKGSTYIAATATTKDGTSRTVKVAGPEAYVFTVECLSKVAQLIRAGMSPLGVLTPSMLPLDLKEIPGVEVFEE